MEAGSRQKPEYINLELKEIDGNYMLKLREAGNLLNWRFYYDGKSQTVMINNGRESCSLEIGTKVFAGQEVSGSSLIKEGRTYIGLDLFKLLLSEMGEKKAPELIVSLLVEEKVIEPGSELEADIIIYNIGEEAVNLKYGSGQLYDLFVLEDGEEIWRWSEGKMFTMALMSRDLAPGESLHYTEEVPAVFTGKYQKYLLSGEIATQQPLLLNEIELETVATP